MKLVFPEIDTPLVFEEGTFCSLVVENPRLLYRILNDLYQQVQGDDGEAILSEEENIISIEKNLELITDYFPFDINSKKLLAKIIAQIEKQAVSPEYFDRTQKLLGTLEKYCYDLAFELALDLDFSRLTVSSLLKAVAPHLRDDAPTLAEKMLEYINLMSEYGLARLFILVNARSFIDDETMEVFTTTCCQHNHSLLLIDCHPSAILTRENRMIIDADLCEIR